MPKKDIKDLLIMLLIGIVWGYFSDLRNGQIAWFVGRIIFMLFIFFALKYFQNLKK